MPLANKRTARLRRRVTWHESLAQLGFSCRHGATAAATCNHDALNVMVRASLMSGELGSHQGLPVTITATVNLEDLQAKTGMAPSAAPSCPSRI
jgi:Domain of unknown function (DUF222)